MTLQQIELILLLAEKGVMSIAQLAGMRAGGVSDEEILKAHTNMLAMLERHQEFTKQFIADAPR